MEFKNWDYSVSEIVKHFAIIENGEPVNIASFKLRDDEQGTPYKVCFHKENDEVEFYLDDMIASFSTRVYHKVLVGIDAENRKAEVQIDPNTEFSFTLVFDNITP